MAFIRSISIKNKITGALDRLWKKRVSFSVKRLRDKKTAGVSLPHHDTSGMLNEKNADEGASQSGESFDKKTTGVSLPHSESKLDHDTPGMLNEKNADKGASQSGESFDKKTTGVSLPHSESKLDHDTPGMLNEKNADKGASQLQSGESLDLLSAIRDGKLGVIEQLLEGGTPVDMQRDDGRSALMHACLNGQTEVAKLLLERGAQVDLVDNEGLSALIWASIYRQTEMVKLLLERGAKVDLQDNDGRSVLMWASVSNTEQMDDFIVGDTLMEYLVGWGTLKTVTQQRNRGTEIVQVLLERGAQVDLQDSKGWFALMSASI